jgi:hypothetical protein
VSIPVDLAALPDQISRFGPGAFLVTTAIDGSPHIASVVVAIGDGTLTMGAGRRTRANVAHHAAVVLMWTSGADRDHCLLVDGTATTPAAESETLTVRPTSAVLHRLAT